MKSNAGGIVISDFNIYCEAVVTKNNMVLAQKQTGVIEHNTGKATHTPLAITFDERAESMEKRQFL